MLTTWLKKSIQTMIYSLSAVAQSQISEVLLKGTPNWPKTWSRLLWFRRLQKSPRRIPTVQTLLSPSHNELRLEMALKGLGVEKGREYAAHCLDLMTTKLTRPDHPWSVVMDEMHKEVTSDRSIATDS